MLYRNEKKPEFENSMTKGGKELIYREEIFIIM